MHGTVLQDHKTNPPEKPDLVQVMLTGRDKETGVGLSDQSIKNNVRNQIDHMLGINLTRFRAAFDFLDCR